MSTRVIQKIIQFIHLVLHRGFGSFTSNPYIFKINNIVPRCSGTFIKKNRNIRVLGITASLALSILTIATIFPITKQSDTAEATYVPATTTLSIVSSKDTASVNITPTSASGTFATSAAADMAEFTVTTDNLTGYSLNILGTDTSGQLVNSTTGDTLDTIAADTTENDFRTGNTSTYNNKWGYRLTVNSTTTTNFFSAPTSTSTAKTIYTTSAPNTTGTSDSFTLGVGARVDYTKPVGTYTNTFVLTAVANNITYAINYLDNTGDTITDLPAAEGSSNITASSFTLSSTEPQRTGYDFIGWCDGTVTHVASGTDTCAGTTYQAGDTYTFTNISSASTNTANLYTMWEMEKVYMQDYTKAMCQTNAASHNATVTDKRDNNNYTVRYINGDCWMTQNLRYVGDTVGSSSTTSTWYLKSATSNVSADKTMSMTDLASDSPVAYDSYDYAKYHNSRNTTTGVWYNYAAASAMTITGSSNTTKATYDICPKGWRLPTGGSGSEQVGIISYYTQYAPVTGGHYSNGNLNDVGRGSYWSSTSSNASYRSGLLWYGGELKNYNLQRSNGRYMRCIRSS